MAAKSIVFRIVHSNSAYY